MHQDEIDKEYLGWERWQREDMIKEYKIMKDTEMMNKEGLFFFVVVILFSNTRTKDSMKLQI